MLKTTEIRQFINEDRASVQKQHAKKGMQYYEGDHDIKQYKIYYFDENGILQEDETRSNERISHAFFTELIDQSTQYILSGDTAFVRSDEPALQKELDTYFDDVFKMELNDLLTYTSIEGFSYLYRYVDEHFKTRFKFADGLSVVEAPAKYTSDGKDYVIYYYYWKTEKNKRIYKVEVWDDTYMYPYTMINGTIKEDGEPRPHVLYSEGNQQYYDTFGEVPFIRLDNNKKQFSDLKIIKDLIDDYDLMSCGLSNNIQDVAEGIYVIKGYTGNNLDELTQNIKTKKRVAVGEGGDVEIKTIQIPYEARKIKLELDEKNIYRFGMGFDSSKTETSNVTNVVIKSRYALLDLKSNKKEMQLRRMMKKIIKIVLDEINKVNKTSYSENDVYMVFDRVVPTNETDNANIELTNAQRKQVEINTLLNIATKIDDETLLQNICDVLDIDYETIKDRVDKDKGVSTDEARKILDNTEDKAEE